MKYIGGKHEFREINYLFNVLEREWERSGRTVTNRKMNQDALSMFSEYYVRKIKEYEREQQKIETKTFQEILRKIKEMSILLRITKRFVVNQKLRMEMIILLLNLIRKKEIVWKIL